MSIKFASSNAASAAGCAAVAAAALSGVEVNAHRVDLAAPEYFDVRDAQGRSTGEKKLRSKVHADGDWHSCVHVWLIHAETGKVLLAQRAPAKDSFPSCWDVSCAGHLSAGETVGEATAAELAEELGVQVPAGVSFNEWCKHIVTLPREVISQGGQFIDREHTHCFMVEGAWSTGDLTLQADEVAQVRWEDIDTLREALRKGDDRSYVTYPDVDAYDREVFRRIEERSRQIKEKAAAA